MRLDRNKKGKGGKSDFSVLCKSRALRAARPGSLGDIVTRGEQKKIKNNPIFSALLLKNPPGKGKNHHKSSANNDRGGGVRVRSKTWLLLENSMFIPKTNSKTQHVQKINKIELSVVVASFFFF